MSGFEWLRYLCGYRSVTGLFGHHDFPATCIEYVHRGNGDVKHSSNRSTFAKPCAYPINPAREFILVQLSPSPQVSRRGCEHCFRRQRLVR